MYPVKLRPQNALTFVTRTLVPSDWAPLLRLNAQNHPAVRTLDETGLAHLLGFDGYHLVAVDGQGEIVGYLLSFPHDSAYDDTEIRWFRQNLVAPFFYICQVVVAREYRQRKIGRALYRDLLETARLRDARTLCCDINTEPPTLGSFAFHYRLGFAGIGCGLGSDGSAIAFLARIF